MLQDFVLETANAPGTGATVSLLGAATGRRSFASAFSNGATPFYVISDGTQAEWGIGTLTTGSPNTLSRTTVLGNTSGTTSRLNFSGSVRVFNDVPSARAVYADAASKVTLPGALAITGDVSIPGYVTSSLTVNSGTVSISATAANASLYLASAGGSGRQYSIGANTAGSMVFYDVTGSAVRMLIEPSGNIGIPVGGGAFYIGTATNPGYGNQGFAAFNDNTLQQGNTGTKTNFGMQRDSTGDYFAFFFKAFDGSAPNTIGSIATSGSSVSYNQTSDQTLKIDDGLMQAEQAGAIVDRLRPRWFRWRAAPGATSEPGFFAQQVHRVFPWAVTRGTGRRGREGWRPWQMDAGKLLPVVVAELQALRRRVAELEARQ